MRLAHNRTFDEERTRFGFAFTCEDCGHFDPERQECRHGFPTEEHRGEYYDVPGSALIFCKEFELE